MNIGRKVGMHDGESISLCVLLCRCRESKGTEILPEDLRVRVYPHLPAVQFRPVFRRRGGGGYAGVPADVPYAASEMPDGGGLRKRSDRNYEYGDQHGRPVPYHLYDTGWAGQNQRGTVMMKQQKPASDLPGWGADKKLELVWQA